MTNPSPNDIEVAGPIGDDRPTAKAIRACADWLHCCLELGWPKSSLDDLNELWWQYHDARGNLIQ